jgi:hypothetical protein
MGEPLWQTQVQNVKVNLKYYIYTEDAIKQWQEMTNV